MRNLVMGKAVHNATASILQDIYGSEAVQYSRNGLVDFKLNTGLEDSLVELTTPNFENP